MISKVLFLLKGATNMLLCKLGMLLVTVTPGCCSKAKPRAAAKGKKAAKAAVAAVVAEPSVIDTELQHSPRPVK